MKVAQAVILVLVTMVSTHFITRSDKVDNKGVIRRPPPDSSVADALEYYDQRLGRVEDLVVAMSREVGQIHQGQKKASQKRPPPNPNKKLESLLKAIQDDFQGVTNEQLALIEQIMQLPAEQASFEREVIIKNQTVVSNLVKDVQWENTPMHRIIIGTLSDLALTIPYGTDDAIDPILKSFPTEIHLATPSLKGTAKHWNTKTEKVMDMLLESGGVFNVHILLEDFIKNGNDHNVNKFLIENLDRSHIVIYCSSVFELVEAFKTHRTRSLFKRFKPHIRLDIGPRALQLRGARNNITCKDFLTAVLQSSRSNRR